MRLARAAVTWLHREEGKSKNLNLRGTILTVLVAEANGDAFADDEVGVSAGVLAALHREGRIGHEDEVAIGAWEAHPQDVGLGIPLRKGALHGIAQGRSGEAEASEASEEKEDGTKAFQRTGGPLARRVPHRCAA